MISGTIKGPFINVFLIFSVNPQILPIIILIIILSLWVSFDNNNIYFVI